MFQNLKSGCQVAIVPKPDSSPAETQEIATVTYAGNVVVQLTDGRLYTTNAGEAFSLDSFGYIVPATEKHRAAVFASLQS